MRIREFSSSSLPPHQILGMPSLSPTMDKGNITVWKKEEGDELSPGKCIVRFDLVCISIPPFSSLKKWWSLQSLGNQRKI